MTGAEGIASQWCMLHNCHQDDPAHDYLYPACEDNLRLSTPAEDAALLRVLSGGWWSRFKRRLRPQEDG